MEVAETSWDLSRGLDWMMTESACLSLLFFSRWSSVLV